MFAFADVVVEVLEMDVEVVELVVLVVVVVVVVTVVVVVVVVVVEVVEVVVAVVGLVVGIVVGAGRPYTRWTLGVVEGGRARFLTSTGDIGTI